MASHSKTKVDRAGRHFAEQTARFVGDPKLVSDPNDLAQMREAVEVIEWWRSEHAKPLSRVAANLRYYVGEEGQPVVAQRLKRVPTIAGKLLREPGMKLSRMADIGGVRAILPSQDAAYRVSSRLRRNWTITRVRDYIAEPKADGYRALHLIGRNRGRMVEIQLRTPLQDFWANEIETISRTSVPGLKFGRGPVRLRKFLFDLAEILAQEDSGLISREETLERARESKDRMSNLVGNDES